MERGLAAGSDSTSGYPGVSNSRKKWKAYISYKGERYAHGYFAEKNDAIAAQKKGGAAAGRRSNFFCGLLNPRIGVYL